SQIWVANIFVNRATAVAAITRLYCIDQIAAQSHQFPVFPAKIEQNRRDGKSLLDTDIRVILPIALVTLIALVAGVSLVALVALAALVSPLDGRAGQGHQQHH